MLTLLVAQRIINGALIRARQLNLNVSVAVCDATGRLIALNQMDGSCRLGSGSVLHGKSGCCRHIRWPE